MQHNMTTSQPSLHALFFLRFISLGSTVITGFIACYLTWWHDSLRQPTPSALIFVILAVSTILPAVKSITTHEIHPN
jgi:hypothetical protein